MKKIYQILMSVVVCGVMSMGVNAMDDEYYGGGEVGAANLAEVGLVDVSQESLDALFDAVQSAVDLGRGYDDEAILEAADRLKEEVPGEFSDNVALEANEDTIWEACRLYVYQSESGDVDTFLTNIHTLYPAGFIAVIERLDIDVRAEFLDLIGRFLGRDHDLYLEVLRAAEPAPAAGHYEDESAESGDEDSDCSDSDDPRYYRHLTDHIMSQ